jgi:Leucine rich repeat
VCTWYGIACEDIDLMTLLNDVDGIGTISNNINRTGMDSDTSFSVVTEIDFTRDDGYYTFDGEMKDPILQELVLPYYNVMVDGILFTGTIPHDIGLLTHLRVINLNRNYVDGTIPSSMSLLSNLGVFVVTENMITGSIPESMQYLTALTHVDISNNNITGTIPSSLSQLANLNRFHATSNSLSGTIPELRWDNIKVFDVSYNQMKGTLPMAMQEWTNLSIFLAMSNKFSGTIPAWIDKLTNMTAFSIARNQFTGTIPSSIQSWNYLNYIDLSSNEILGTVPLLLADSQYVYLQYVNITKNKLDGTIPFSKGFCDFLLYFSGERNAFQASIPDGYEYCVTLRNFGYSSRQNCKRFVLRIMNLLALYRMESTSLFYWTFKSKIICCQVQYLHIWSNGFTLKFLMYPEMALQGQYQAYLVLVQQ